MRFLKIISVSGALAAVDAAILKRPQFARSLRSDHIIPELSLAATLQPVNATHVKVSITNTYSHQISILSWNNHFQTNHNAAHESFKLSHTSSNGSITTLGRGPTMGHYRFAETVPSHLFNITAMGTYTDEFDLTVLFDVSEANNYNVTMDFESPATLVAKESDRSFMVQNTNNYEGEALLDSIPIVKIKSNSISVHLQASLPPHILHKRESNPIGACSSQPQAYATIVKARGNARSLAKFAQQAVLPPLGISAHGLRDATLWKQYFNNDSAALNVTSVYSAIADYGLNGNLAGIQEYCDLNDNDNLCTDDGGTIAYDLSIGANGGLSSGGGTTITFCRGFFDLPVADTCNYASEGNIRFADQGGVFLHELAKCEALTGLANVTEGGDDDCSTWSCITAAVANENTEKSWLLAGAYEYFAYAARAQASSHCPRPKAVGPQPLPFAPHSPPGPQDLGGASSSSNGGSGAGVAGSETGIGAGSGGDSGSGSGGGGGFRQGSGSGGGVGSGLGGSQPRYANIDASCDPRSLSC